MWDSFIFFYVTLVVVFITDFQTLIARDSRFLRGKSISIIHLLDISIIYWPKFTLCLTRIFCSNCSEFLKRQLLTLCMCVHEPLDITYCIYQQKNIDIYEIGKEMNTYLWHVVRSDFVSVNNEDIPCEDICLDSKLRMRTSKIQSFQRSYFVQTIWRVFQNRSVIQFACILST